MLNYDLQLDKDVLVLNPDGPLEASDFQAVATQVDNYLVPGKTLRGVMIRADSFPGWKDFSALIAHMKFVRDHHRRIGKVAVVADGLAASMLPAIGNHFVHAEVRHFKPQDEAAAWSWLTQDGELAMAEEGGSGISRYTPNTLHLNQGKGLAGAKGSKKWGP